jgi:uncharacterized membrane protein YpjA
MDLKKLFLLLCLLMCAAVFIGFGYYFDQLAFTPLLLWIFVPDCPLYVLLTLPILAKKIRSDAYSFLVSIGMFKYGLWTVFVLLFYSEYWQPSQIWITVPFIIGHIGMALLGAALLPKKKVAASIALVVLAWFLLNDYADYFLGTRPLIPSHDISLIRDLTIAASIILTLGFFLYAEKIRSFAPVKFFREVIQN